MPDFIMPSLGADMESGTLVCWRKHLGEHVDRGDVIAEVETDKGVIEVECFTAGTIDTLFVEPGTKVPVGTKLAHIRETSESAAVPNADAQAASTGEHGASSQERPQHVLGGGAQPPLAARSTLPVRATPSARRLLREQGRDTSTVQGTGSHGTVTRADALRKDGHQTSTLTLSTSARARVSPLARRRAQQLGVTITGLRGSGPGGSVIAADVEAAARERTQTGVQAEQSSPNTAQTRMRRAIGQAMARSKREIPHYYLSQSVDLAETWAWLTAENERRSVATRLLSSVLFLRATLLAIKKVPELNAFYEDGHSEPLAHVNLGVAVALRGGGLIAPAILDAHTLTLDALSAAFKDLVNRARGGQLRSSEISSATLTVTSLGERGVETVFPIIIPPQVAMVGFGSVAEKPVVVGSTVVARPAVTVTLAADHRVSDGHRGSLYLAALAAILKEPPTC